MASLKIKRAFVLLIVGALLLCLVMSAEKYFASAEASKGENSSDFWLSLAENAWNYFQPGVGIDPNTGLIQGYEGGPYFTDWDLGLYVQAIVDAEKLGILTSDGEWGADDRINRVLTFLEHRPLSVRGVPFFFYSSQTGNNSVKGEQVATDAGNLFVGLKNLENAKPELKSRIDNIVYSLTNNEPRKVSVDILLGQVSNGTRQPEIYDYYVICGYAGFWPERFSGEADAMLNLILSRSKINYHDILLPSAKITSEPLLLLMLNTPAPDMRALSLSKEVYLAQEARYNLTGKFTAFSEGPSDCSPFLYEWVTLPDGRMWVVQTINSKDVTYDVEVAPIVYLKVAISYLALYNTPYTQTMVTQTLEHISQPWHGYNSGFDENERKIESPPDVGNSLIVSAARYAVENNVRVPFSYPNGSASTSITPQATDPLGETQQRIKANQETAPSPPANKPEATPAPSLNPADTTQDGASRGLEKAVWDSDAHYWGCVFGGIASAAVVMVGYKIKKPKLTSS